MKKIDIRKQEFELYMLFFDMKIDIKTLKSKLIEIDELLLNQSIINYFYNIVKSFAKNNFNIDNFDYFVANRQLFKYCFDICTKYANDELSIIQ